MDVGGNLRLVWNHPTVAVGGEQAALSRQRRHGGGVRRGGQRRRVGSEAPRGGASLLDVGAAEGALVRRRSHVPAEGDVQCTPRLVLALRPSPQVASRAITARGL